MKKKTFSIFILMVLTFSMAFSSYTPSTNEVTEISNEPISAAKPANTILDVGDALYYNVFMGGYNEMEDRYYEDNGVVKLVVNETDTNYIRYMPYWFKNDGGTWDWIEDPPEGDDPHMYDNYTYDAFMHSWSVATDVGEMWDVNQSENVQDEFGTAMNSSVVTAYFSNTGEANHNITMSCDRDDNSSTPVFIEWIGDKTTGLCLSYIETGIDDNITAELAGYDILALPTPLTAPTSFGLSVGDWIDYFVPESERHDDDSESSSDGNYHDWLERGNDDWGTAFNLNSEFGVPGHWWDLSLYENFDYYRFHAENGDSIAIDAWTDPGSDLVLESLDTGDGHVILVDSENGDSDGWVHLDSPATYSGDYIIGFRSEDSVPHGEWYDFQISINSLDITDYFPEEGLDDHDDRPESMFIRQSVEFLYTNPLGEEVLVVKSEGHKDADMMDTPLFVDYREQGRIDLNNINIIEGPYFHKDLDMTSGTFQSSMEDMFTEEGGSISTFISNTDWVEMWGVTDEGADFYFFAERFPDYNFGAIQYYEQSEYNSTDEYFIKKDKQMAIGSSISGLINDVCPELGVAVGDDWTYLAQESGEEEQWGDDPYDYSFENVHYVTITVTHVFHVNRTVVAVIGSTEHWSNDDPDYPERRDFQPILVWDTTDPMSFFTYGGHGRLQEGPPFLLPAGVDWSVHESEFIPMMDMFMDEDNTVQVNIDTSSVRISWEGDREADHYEQGRVFLDVNSNGIVTHISQEGENRDPDYKRRNKLEGFAIEISNGCSKTLASDVTEVNSGDEFIWEKQQFSPEHDPTHYTHIRDNILTVEETCGEFIVFLGAREYRNWNETDYHGNTWKYWDESIDDYVDTGINQWLLGSIQDANIWSWVNSQYFDIGLTDFAGNEAELAELLTFALELPDGFEITASHITTSGLTFEVVLTFEESPGVFIDHVMQLAVNNKGIMQEMFMGSRDSSDVWLDWEYTVLISAPSGYDVGNVLPDLPVEDIHGLEGSAFDIPGFSGAFLVLASVIGIISLLALISNRRRY